MSGAEACLWCGMPGDPCGHGQEAAIAAVPDWYTDARRAVAVLAARGRPFTAEDLTAVVGLPREVGTNRNNAIGAVFSAAAKEGVIRSVGYRNSERRSSHGRILRVWAGVRPVHEWPDL